MENSMVRPCSGNSSAGFSRQPSNEMFQQCDPQITRHFVKEEMPQTISCARMAWQEQEGQSAVMRDNDGKTVGSPPRYPSPEFLLRTSTESGQHCGGNETEEIPTKDHDNSANSTTNDVITPTTCIYCNKMFASKTSLDVHVLELHDGKKVYDCSVCDKQFSHRSSRNIHLRVHTGQRPYECEICKKRFRVSSHLRDHVRTHTGERPFKCVLCGRGFKQSSDMKKHRKTHYKTSSSAKTNFNDDELVQGNPEHLPSNSGNLPSNSGNLPNNYCNLPSNSGNLPSNSGNFPSNSGNLPSNSGNLPRNLCNLPSHSDNRPSSSGNLPSNSGNLPSNAQPSPEHNKRNGVDETANPIKVEKKSSCERAGRPLSCDSGVKLESDRSASPENITREKNTRYNEPLVQKSAAAIDVTTSPRMHARYYGYSNGLNFQEPTRSSVASFYHSVLRNNYQFQSTSEKIPENHFQEQQMYAGYPMNTQYIENRAQHPVATEIQNGEVMNEIGNRPRTNSDDARSTMVPSTFYQMENSDVATSSAQQDLGKTTEKDPTQEQGKTSEDTNTQDGIVPMDVATAATSEDIDVEKPSEDTVDGSDVAGKTTGEPGVVRKAVVVKLRQDKGSPTVKQNTVAPAVKKLAARKGRAKGTMQCATCMERFRSLETFTAHTCDKNEKPFKCTVCSKMFARSTLLRQHMVLHQGTKRFKFKCNYCGRAFRHRSHLRDHERIHTGERPFKCNFCPKAFKQSSDLRKHENLHTGATRYCCEKCGVDFKRSDALKKHAMLHPEGEVTVLKCEKCQSLFATSGQSAHVCHSKNRYRCQLCVQRFSSATALRQHCHQEHGDQSNTTCLKCEFCKLELQSLDELEVHLGTHQLQKSHKCNSCDKQYSLISQLEEHAKTHAKRTQDAVSEASNNPLPPVQPLTTKEFPGANEAEHLYKDKELNTIIDNTDIAHVQKSGQKVTEANTVITQSVAVISSSNESVRQKYDFIPSSYQSLVRSAPMYGYIKNMVNAARWYPPSNINEAGAHDAIPPLLKSQPTAQQDRETSGNRTELVDHTPTIVRPNPTIDDKRPTAGNTEHAATTKQTTDAQEREVDERFPTPLRQGSPKRAYDCLNCSKSFSQENLLTNHVCFIQSETFFHCIVCEKEFRYYEDLLEHLRIHWKQVVYIRCNVCGERVKNEDRLKEHNLKHIEQNRKRRYMSEQPGGENDVTSPWESTAADQRRFPSEGSPETGAALVSWAPTTISSLSTPVITSISGNNPFYSKAANHGQPAMNPHPRERMAPKDKVVSPRISQRSANETADNDNRSLAKVHSVNEEVIPRSGSQDPQATYFETRKSVNGAFLNVFCQGSAMVVPAMQSLDVSGRHPGGTGMMYPITMAYEQRRISEQKNYEN